MKRRMITAGIIAAVVIMCCACKKHEPIETPAVTTEAATMAPVTETTAATSAAETTLVETTPTETTAAVKTTTAAATVKPDSDVTVVGGKIQKALASKDMEALSDLISYPVAISYTNGTVMEIASKEDFLALKAESVMPDKFVKAMETVKTASLEMDKDDMAFMGNGTTNIVIGFTETGVLKIVAINH